MYAQPHMLPIRLGARLRPWLLGYMGLVYVVLCALGIHLLAVGRNWPLGDWQTNYEGGFVRRGFLGEIFLVVGRLLHVDPLYFAVAMSLLCYGLLLFTLASLLRQGAMQGWVVLLIVSPATLLFPLLSTRAGFHKEVLYFAALSALVLLYRNGRKLPAVPVAAGLSVVAVVLLLSHEPIAFFLPYCLAALFVATGDADYVLRVCAVPAALSVAAFLLAAHYTGSPHIVQAICASVHADAAHPCSEAITYLVEDRAGARAMVQQNIAELHYYRHYPALLLALLPVTGRARPLEKVFAASATRRPWLAHLLRGRRVRNALSLWVGLGPLDTHPHRQPCTAAAVDERQAYTPACERTGDPVESRQAGRRSAGNAWVRNLLEHPRLWSGAAFRPAWLGRKHRLPPPSLNRFVLQV